MLWKKVAAAFILRHSRSQFCTYVCLWVCYSLKLPTSASIERQDCRIDFMFLLVLTIKITALGEIVTHLCLYLTEHALQRTLTY